MSRMTSRIHVVRVEDNHTEVRHPPGCSSVVDCLVAYEFDAIGTDALLGNDETPDGFYAVRTWASWSGSMYEDADGGTDILWSLT
jgi:hypothetical protein